MGYYPPMTPIERKLTLPRHRIEINDETFQRVAASAKVDHRSISMQVEFLLIKALQELELE